MHILKKPDSLTGFLNECGGAVVQVSTDVHVTGTDTDIEMQECTIFSQASPQESSAIGQVFDMAFDDGQDDTQTCYPNDIVPHSSAVLDLNLEVLKKRKERMLQLYQGNSNTVTQQQCTCGPNNNAGTSSNNAVDSAEANNVEDWEKSIVTDEMADIMKKYLATKLPVDDIIQDSTINHWFELLPQKDQYGSYANSHFRCNKCYKHGPEFFFHKKYLSDLSKEEGILKPLKKDNSRIIREHHLQPSHVAVIRQLKKKEELRIDEEISGIIHDEVQLIGTNKHMTLVYSGDKKK